MPSRSIVQTIVLFVFSFALAFGIQRAFVSRKAVETAKPALAKAASQPGSEDSATVDSPEQIAKYVTPPPDANPPGMKWIPGGRFMMGTLDEKAWPDEKPTHPVCVSGFWMDETEVTNAQFNEFVSATGYQTTAERAPTLEEIMSQLPPGTPPPDPSLLVPGSLVFTPPDRPVPLNDLTQWWSWVPGASWRHPEGPESNLEGRENHPVVQVSWDDAVAYAKWAGKRLPTEAEWECAARGQLESKRYVWGDESPDAGPPRMNIWQGNFPNKNTKEDGYVRTAPVKSYPPNGFGLYDMAGNVWEWCSDWYDTAAYSRRSKVKLTANPQGPRESYDPTRPGMPLRSQRSGSFLCNDSYCSRYRPSARHGCSPDTGMSHGGFRCVVSLDPDNDPVKPTASE